jgi:hypothetical protein
LHPPLIYSSFATADASILVIKKAPVLLSSSCGLARCQPPPGSSVLLTSTHPRKWLDAPLHLVVLVDPAALRNGKENTKNCLAGLRLVLRCCPYFLASSLQQRLWGHHRNFVFIYLLESFPFTEGPAAPRRNPIIGPYPLGASIFSIYKVNLQG